MIGFTRIVYHWESRAGTTTNAWYMNGREPSVNRGWNLRNICFFQFGNWCKIIRFLAPRICFTYAPDCSGMSVLVAFHCKLERPIRGCDLEVIEKMVHSNHASTGFKWGSSQIQHWSDVVFGSHLWLWYQKTVGAMRAKEDQCGKNLATMNVRGKRAELYETEVNQRSL